MFAGPVMSNGCGHGPRHICMPDTATAGDKRARVVLGLNSDLFAPLWRIDCAVRQGAARPDERSDCSAVAGDMPRTALWQVATGAAMKA